jgi:hypothetical protein
LRFLTRVVSGVARKAGREEPLDPFAIEFAFNAEVLAVSLAF